MRLVAAPHPFKTEQIERFIPEGPTLAEMFELSGIDPMLAAHGHVWIGDQYVPRHLWHRVRPKEGTNITLRVVPHGGGGGGLRRRYWCCTCGRGRSGSGYDRWCGARRVGGRRGPARRRIGDQPMTFVIATITPEAAWFSTDKLRVDSACYEMPGAFDDAYPGGAGRALLIETWAAMVCKVDIEEAAEIAPPRADVGIIAGWSERRGSIAAYVFAEGERTELQHGAHTMMPVPHPDCAGYAEIADLWKPAGCGDGVERFHRLIGGNVRDAYERGLTRPGYGVGREILTVRADRHGVTRAWTT